MLLGSSLGDLELIRVIDTIGAVGATTNLAAVCAMTEDLCLQSAAGMNIRGVHHTLAADSPPAS